MVKYESQKKALEKFKTKVNWVDYCSEIRRNRVERLKLDGVVNPWAVCTRGEKPKYFKYVNFRVCDNSVAIPKKVVEKLGIKKGDKFLFRYDEEKKIFIYELVGGEENE